MPSVLLKYLGWALLLHRPGGPPRAPDVLVRHIGFGFLSVIALTLLWRVVAVPDLGVLVWHMRALNAGAVWLVTAFLIAETRSLWKTSLPAAMIALAVGIWWALWEGDWPWALAWWALQLALIVGWGAAWREAWLRGDRWTCWTTAGMATACAIGLVVGAVFRVLTMQNLDPMAPALKRQSTMDMAGFGGIEIALILLSFAFLITIVFCWRGSSRHG